jgi:hypothetical protein
MLMQPRKKTISIIMARLKPEDKKMAEGGPQEKGHEPGDSMDKSMDKMDSGSCLEDCTYAAEDILFAIRKSDSKILAQALLDFLEIAKNYDNQDSEDSKDSSSEPKEDGESY